MVWNEELKREIPFGWNVMSIFDACDVKYGYPLTTKMFGDSGTPVIRIRDILENTISAYTSEEVSNAFRTKQEDLFFPSSILFTMALVAKN